MHILYLAGWWPHKEDVLDGIFVKEQAQALALYENVSVVFIRVKKTNVSLPFKIETHITQEGRLTVYEVIIQTPLRRFGIHDFLVKKAYDQSIDKISKKIAIDAVIVNVKTQISEVAFSLKKIKSLPAIFIEHSTFYHAGIHLLPEHLKKKSIQGIIEWLKHPQLKYFMPVSNDMANIFITQFHVPRHKIMVTPNIANKVFQFVPYEKHDNKINIALVARWSSPKNPFLFLHALSQLPESTLASLNINWIGDGNLLEEIKEYIQKNLKDIAIHLLGYRDQAYIAKEIQRADFLVHPTDAENLPCIIIESLCCGTPVLTTNVNGIPDLINDSNGLMSPAKDVEKFKDNLLRMIQEFDRYNRKAISENALELYSAEAVGKKTVNILKKSIAK